MASESVLADFVATVDSDVLRTAEPVRGRVLLSQQRLVLAVSGDDTLTVPLSSVVDVGIGQVPEELGGFFNSTVTVAFETNGSQHVAVVEGDDGPISRFLLLLFRALLDGTKLQVRHPARVGGRVTDEPFGAATVSLKPRAVGLERGDETVDIKLDSVTRFRRTRRELASSLRPVVEVNHVSGSRAVVTQLASASARTLSVLGRYVRLEYAELVAELSAIDLSREKTELLVAVYSGAGQDGMSLAQLLDRSGAEVTAILSALERDELVLNGPDGPTLTPKGQVLVTQHFEEVNA